MTPDVTVLVPDQAISLAESGRRLTQAERERIDRFRVQAKSPETRRAYQRGWRMFTDYARRMNWDGVADWPHTPAPPEAVAAFLTDLGDQGLAPATIVSYRAAVSAAHSAAGIVPARNPARDPVVAEVARGLRRGLARDQAQAKALDAEALARIEATARNPRPGRGGRLETPAQAKARGDLDIALARLLHDAGLRRSEASALRWRDIERERDGSGRVTVQRGKNHSDPRTMYVTARTVQALRAIRPRPRRPEAPVFPSPRDPDVGLGGAAISARITSAALAAGLGHGYSGHSGRVGLARDMVARGAPSAVVMRQGRWNSSQMVSRYTRNAAAAEAGRWMD